MARLATVSAGGRPHIVPITFALDADTVYTAVDDKPKRTSRLRRLENIAANEQVSVLVADYQDDWSRLWWGRAEGVARIVAPGDPEHRHAVELLQRRYVQYRERPPAGPAIAVAVLRWSGWRASGD